ncbi:MAG: homoserine O-acetyltransferase [Microbacteriaceae bacterium]
MDWQTPEDTVPSDFVTDANIRSLLGKPPASGAWREGDPIGNRMFLKLDELQLERGGILPKVSIAFETFGTLNASASNAVLIPHALTGDSHIIGKAGSGHATAGWWSEVVGPGKAVDTDQWFVVVPNMLGGCQGSTGPAHLAPDNQEWASRFPFVTIRDQVESQRALLDYLGIPKWAAVIGGSVGGMQSLEWAATYPELVERVAVIAAPPVTTADQIAFTSLQVAAIKTDPAFNDGFYYDAADGEGPHQGISLARKVALLTYRGAAELNERFGRSWQSGVSPLGGGGVYAVESYLDFHGNKFARRFDANSYITLVTAMDAHDIGRDRGGYLEVLQSIRVPLLVIGIDSDRLFPLEGQREIAKHVPSSISGTEPVTLETPYGHDGFLIESDAVGAQLRALLG